MSTATSSAPTRAAAKSNVGLSFGGILRSEWIKFRSLRSTQILLLVTFLAMVGIGSLAAFLRSTIIQQIVEFGSDSRNGAVTSGQGTHLPMSQAIEMANQQGITVYGIPIAGIQIGILVLGALAVLLISSEYSTGMIRSTFAAVPKRTPVFFAKAIVLIVVSYVLTLLAALVTFLIALPIMHSYDIPFSFGTDGLVRGMLLAGVYVAGVAVAGLSLGTLLRNSAGGIMVLVGLFFLLEFAGNLLSLIPGDFWKYVGQYTPSVAGGRWLEIGDKPAFISPGEGGLIFLAWILVLVIPAIFVLKKRDV